MAILGKYIVKSNRIMTCKRKEEYNDFLEFTQTEPLKIIKHCATRWLSLEKSGSCLIVDMVGQMKTLLKTFLGNFLKIASIKSAEDVTQVDYTNKDNYLPVDFIAIGMKARTVLADNQDNLEPSTLHRIYSGQD
ncbi:hypothetical protein LOTGIDRAFT_155143 [Lottia gigantea]|uniref:Uncharacterized protein n=1 Tax=Lottia gigantea TaxID=225164 RepID=V3ZXF6_LOTGI|nr:hypothetical protein LOTGIDRAFT_155143 [Lottia gigantea]ESO85651.1 hypothetical protein LOTGIDRAFT_155143 [Lottia gigantea]